MTLPRSAMITPDVVSSSDASWAVRSCCQNAKQALVEEEEEQEFQDECTSTSSNKDRFWDSFAVSSEVFKKHLSKASYQNGTKLLVTIFRERKKAEDILMKAQRRATEEAAESEHRTLANSSVVSSIAPLLVFLIHQRFAECDCPAMVSSSSPISFNDDMHRTQPSPHSYNFCTLCTKFSLQRLLTNLLEKERVGTFISVLIRPKFITGGGCSHVAAIC